MTMQLKLEASKGSCFIIPMKAFDVIENLPDGGKDENLCFQTGISCGNDKG